MQVWVNNGDIVLVSLREYEEDRGDIIHKYYNREAAKLIAYGEIPDTGIYISYTQIVYYNFILSENKQFLLTIRSIVILPLWRTRASVFQIDYIHDVYTIWYIKEDGDVGTNSAVTKLRPAYMKRSFQQESSPLAM